MTWISASDPLALVYIANGQIPAPNTGSTSAVRSDLDVSQRAAAVGEPVPIVFAWRRNDAGGVLISPGATECAFRNDAIPHTNLTVNYHLVLGEGQMGLIPLKDLFHGPCRVGSHVQTYNRRAGTWEPGNFLQAYSGIALPEASYYCGIVGSYPRMSTLSFEATYDIGAGWKRQVHCFIREGMYVTRLVDGVFGPSDSFADLVQWIHLNSGRVPAALIDVPLLTTADKFLAVNGFTCNAYIKDAQNISDVLAKWAPYFLLKETRNGGKRGLRPLLPTTSTGAIDTGAVTWKYSFTEDDIIPGTFEVQYSSLTNRQPFVVQANWRQQLESDFGIPRTAEVRYAGTAELGPYESHDLTAFCTNETHAVKVAAYILSKRVRTTHAVRFTAKPGAHNRLITPGDIIHIKLSRTASIGGETEHDYLYQVERITRTLAGEQRYEAIHFPTDINNRSLIALDVDAATATGVLLESNKTGLGCDVNSPTDNTLPADAGLYGSPPESPTDLPPKDPPTNPGGTTPTNPDGEPPREPVTADDGLDTPPVPLGRSQVDPTNDSPVTLYPVQCESGRDAVKVEWWYKPVKGKWQLVAKNTSMSTYVLDSATPILPIKPGVQLGSALIEEPGSRYYAVYFCPKAGQTGAAETSYENKRYSDVYTVTQKDLNKFFPNGTTGSVSVAYKLRVLRNDGFNPFDPLYWVNAPYIAYHHVVFSPGIVTGFQNGVFDYKNPANSSNAALSWNILQGPSVVGFDITEVYVGPTSSLPLGTMTGPPSDWTAYTFSNGVITPK